MVRSLNVDLAPSMCGLLYVYSKKSLDANKLQELSSQYISKRGPNYDITYEDANQYIHQSVLAIQSDPCKKKSIATDEGFLLYNGEAYTKKCGILPKFDSKLDNIYRHSSPSELARWMGEVDAMYAIINIVKTGETFKDVYVHRDPQGEKRLYYYYDDEVLMISSVPGAIREYLDLKDVEVTSILDYIARRHMIYPYSCAIDGIKELLPGESIRFRVGDKIEKHESRRRSIVAEVYDRAYAEFLASLTIEKYLGHVEEVMKETCKMISISAPRTEVAVVASGGVDSTLVSKMSLKYLDKTQAYSLDFGGKEQPLKILDSVIEKELRNKQRIDVEEYYESMKRCHRLLAGPLPTHSFASSWLLGRLVKQEGYKVVLGGEGADETFMGYGTYLDNKRLNDSSLESAYTRRDRDVNQINEFDKELRSKGLDYLNMLRQDGIGCKDACKRVSSFLDIEYQLPAIGYLSADLAISDHGVEGRTPFARWHLMRLAVNSPVGYLIDESQALCKKPLVMLFRKELGIQPPEKSGFAGFPNETLRFLGNTKHWLLSDILGKKIELNQSKELCWKYINIEHFLREL